MGGPVLDVAAIERLLPHRPPILLVDRVLELGEGHVVAEKAVSANEPVFAGHFPGRPVLPGVYLLEAMAQAAGVWVLATRPETRGRPVALLGIDRARFRRPVVPGDAVRIEARMLRRRGDTYRFEARASVAGERAAEAELLAAVLEG